MTPIYLVDAFTDKPFAGNPAGVCPLPAGDWPGDDRLQHIAAEMNQAETAFVRPRDDGEYDLRWFTPALEVDLCGHATLATAHVLWQSGATGKLTFHTRSGPLVTTKVGGDIEMDFPLTPVIPTDPPAGLVAAVGGGVPRFVGRTKFDYLLELANEAAVRSVSPDLMALAAIQTRGVIVTAVSADPKYQFVSRFFAPAAGIAEDPVTGSAHCGLADYWGRMLGRDALVGYQASRRGGVVKVRLVGGDRVALGGRAVTVVRGDLLQ